MRRTFAVALLMLQCFAHITAAPLDLNRWLDRKAPADGAPLTVSANGQWIAVTMSGLVPKGQSKRGKLPREAAPGEVLSEWVAGSEVWIVERATGRVLRPFAGFVGSSLPVWDPSGSRLLLTVQEEITRFPRLALWTVGSDSPRVFAEATVLVTPRSLTGTSVWLPGGEGRVLFRHHSPQKPLQPVLTQTTYGGAGGIRNSQPPHFPATLALLDTRDGSLRRFPEVAEAVSATEAFRVSPDRRRVAFAGKAGSGFASLESCRLTILTLDSGVVETIGEKEPDIWGSGLSWSPDGKRLAWRTKPLRTTGALLLADLAAAQVQAIALPSDASSGILDLYGPAAPPVWDADGGGLWVPGKDSLLHFSNAGAVMGTLPLPPGGGIDWLENGAPNNASAVAHQWPAAHSALLVRKGSIQRVTEDRVKAEPWSKTPPTSQQWAERTVYREGGLLFTLRQTSDDSIELLETSLRNGQISRVWRLHDGIGTIDSGPIKSLTWKLPDGTACGGTLLLPLGWKQGDRPAVVMDLYGGDRSKGQLSASALHDASAILNPYLLSARGLAFFKPDLPQTDAEPAGSLVRATLAAAEALSESGFVDAERIGLLGHSYGGYTVLSVLTQSARFRCGVCACGIYDLPRLALEGQSDFVESGQGRMRASLWDNPKRYLENSPIYALNKLTTPLLVLHGTAQERDDAQGKSLALALVRLNKKAEYLVAPDMGHVPAKWSVEAQQEMIPRVLSFLEKLLRPF